MFLIWLARDLSSLYTLFLECKMSNILVKKTKTLSHFLYSLQVLNYTKREFSAY